ncbi:MAG: hypothetical protein U5K00_15740 [Melioribacteraceae bacterium]|nr:hypothetical protein [Melioribacteraceae bacterium]
MKYNFLNKATHILLLIIFISHLTFAHELMSEYVICTGTDGHVAIENVNECDDCNDINYYVEPTNDVEIKQQDCEDVALYENCFEEEQFLPKDKMILSFYSITISVLPEPAEDQRCKTNLNDYSKLSDPILESYTTVSLII